MALLRETGRLIGIMAFFNASEAANFAPRHVFLARHLGRQMASLVDSQFDLMTGLYTRDGIEQMFAQLSEQHGAAVGSVIYVDVDHMHVVNELHGFELGNELIVRVAELLATPLAPTGTLSARISGDRFALVCAASWNWPEDFRSIPSPNLSRIRTSPRRCANWVWKTLARPIRTKLPIMPVATLCAACTWEIFRFGC